MSRSLEHSPKFHMARRIAKVIAPDFRILARGDLGRQESVLDLKARTIEVGESATEFDMVGYVLFHLGHIRLQEREDLQDHFGKITTTVEPALITRLSKQGALADALAAKWAYEVFTGNFNVAPERATAIISGQTWSEEEWHEYYSS